MAYTVINGFHEIRPVDTNIVENKSIMILK